MMKLFKLKLSLAIIFFVFPFFIGADQLSNPPANQNSTKSKLHFNRYQSFQLFDNQFNVGLGFTNGVTSPNVHNSLWTKGDFGTYNNFYNNLELEKLFDIGVWLLLDGTLVNSYSQSANQNLDANKMSGNNITGNYPYFGGFSAKLGYAFTFNNDILITPYTNFGRSTNMSSFALDNLAVAEQNITSSYYNNFGFGFRLEAIAISDYLQLYLDEYLGKNFNQTPIEKSIFYGDPSYEIWTTTLGLKWRVAYNFQIGANYGFSADYPESILINKKDSQHGSSYYLPAHSSSYMLTFGFNY